MRRTIAAAVSLALPASGWAQVAARPAPSLGEGVQLGVDPWVADYKQTMDQLTQQMNQVGYEIRDIRVTPTPEGKKKARAELAEEVKKADAIEALAKAAEQTMVAHVLSGPKKVHRLGVLKKVKDPGFDQKEDSAAARPYQDATLRRKADPQSADDGSVAASAAARPRMKSLASNFSYNATGGGVSSRFGSSPSVPDVGAFLAPAPRTPSAAFADPGASAPAGSGWAPPPAAGVGSGPSLGNTSDGGPGMSSGWSGSSGGASDFKPAANPSAASLSTNKSDVAKIAYDRAQQQAEQKRQDAKEAAQQAQQEQQMKMQMMVTLLTQGAQIALKLIEDREKKKKEKETK